MENKTVIPLKQRHAVHRRIFLSGCGRQHLEHSAFADSHRYSKHRCVIISLYSGKMEYGHRRQKLFMDFGVWPETAIRLSPPQTFLWIFRKPRWLLWLEDTSTDEVSPCSSSASMIDSNAD
jgi:hypothetical protein